MATLLPADERAIIDALVADWWERQARRTHTNDGTDSPDEWATQRQF